MTLGPLPADFVTTRDALHQVAFFAVAPARYRAVGRMGLRATPGGFGTPQFQGRVARVEGDLLVHEQDGNIATRNITTVRDAAEFLGLSYQVDWFENFHDPLEPADPDSQLQVDLASARALGHWFEFAWEALEALRAKTGADDDVSEVQLWPEHFDPATEAGDSDRGQRASYGASPGDAAHPEPYLYVSAWGEIDRSDPYWADIAFNGASLGYSALAAAHDPVAKGLDFLLAGYEILHSD